jgi:hypothetical protein
MHYIDHLLSDFLDSYTRAFDNKDMDAILEHFYYPCLLITGQSAIGSKNKEELRDVIQRYSRYIAGGQLALSTSYSLRSFYHLDDNNIIISLLWQVSDRSGLGCQKSLIFDRPN